MRDGLLDLCRAAAEPPCAAAERARAASHSAPSARPKAAIGTSDELEPEGAEDGHGEHVGDAGERAAAISSVVASRRARRAQSDEQQGQTAEEVSGRVPGAVADEAAVGLQQVDERAGVAAERSKAQESSGAGCTPLSICASSSRIGTVNDQHAGSAAARPRAGAATAAILDRCSDGEAAGGEDRDPGAVAREREQHEQPPPTAISQRGAALEHEHAEREARPSRARAPSCR